jgi:hypothetical protein
MERYQKIIKKDIEDELDYLPIGLDIENERGSPYDLANCNPLLRHAFESCQSYRHNF